MKNSKKTTGDTQWPLYREHFDTGDGVVPANTDEVGASGEDERCFVPLAIGIAVGEKKLARSVQLTIKEREILE